MDDQGHRRGAAGGVVKPLPFRRAEKPPAALWPINKIQVLGWNTLFCTDSSAQIATVRSKLSDVTRGWEVHSHSRGKKAIPACQTEGNNGWETNVNTGQKVAVEVERLLTAVDVARMTGLSTETLAQWRSQRRGIPFIKLSRNVVRYRHSDLDDWLAGRLVPVETEPSIPGTRS
jgi:predicted DNA-binding transcriptional regulator AlpA